MSSNDKRASLILKLIDDFKEQTKCIKLCK